MQDFYRIEYYKKHDDGSWSSATKDDHTHYNVVVLASRHYLNFQFENDGKGMCLEAERLCHVLDRAIEYGKSVRSAEIKSLIG